MNDKILLVDDEVSILVLLEEVLILEGFTILTATNVKEGFRLAKQCHPFLLLTDLKLQNGIDGATLAGQVKRENPYIVSIAITGHLSSFDKGYLLGSVFTDILLKPIDNELLLKVVHYAQDKYERWRSY